MKPIKQKKYFLFLLALFLLLSSYTTLFAKVSGTTAGNFLSIDLGAKPTAMGGAYTAVGIDAESLAYNPAGIAFMNSAHLSFTHTQWLEDINLEYFGAAIPTSIGSFGISGRILAMEQMNRTTVAQPSGTGEKFGASDTAFGLTYGRRFFTKFSFGASIKSISEKIDTKSASTMSADIGLRYAPTSRLSVGMSALNQSGSLKFITESYNLPREERVGIAYKFLPNENLAVAGDIKIDSDSNASPLLGAEWQLGKCSLRAGYASDIKDNVDSASGISLGLGVKIGSFELNYAWVPYGDFDATHRISFGVWFPGGSKDADKKMLKKTRKQMP